MGAIGVLFRGQVDVARIAVEGVPDRRHCETGDSHDHEHDPPAEAQHQEGEERHGDRGAQRRGAIEDSGREAAVARMEPVPDHASAGRELRRLADAQQQASGEELAKALDNAAEELGERPKSEAESQQPARPELVDHCACRQLRKRVSPEEGGQEVAHIRDRQMQIVANEQIGDRQGGAVDIVDRAGHDQHGERNPLDRFDPRRRRHHLRYRHFLALNCPIGSFAPTKSTKSTPRSMLPPNSLHFCASFGFTFASDGRCSRRQHDAALANNPLAPQQTRR